MATTVPLMQLRAEIFILFLQKDTGQFAQEAPRSLRYSILE
jgi:hypothetical protein